MRKVPLAESVRIIARGSRNWFAGRPIVVSFEVTDSCTCYCKHCDHGGPAETKHDLKPADYKRYMKALRPSVVQVSGGAPLMRRDLIEIIKNIKSASGLPYTILVSNWSLMTKERYLALREAGVNQFSVSLDFPDERHDEFRQLKGLYQHLREVIPSVAKLGHDDIVLNNCITSENVSEMNAVADKAKEWGVNVSYSAYSPRRTGCRDYFLNTPEQLATLKDALAQIQARMDESHWIVNAKSTLEATGQYFRSGGAPGCKAGLRFLVVRSNGMLQPCSMQFQQYPLHERARMVKEFTQNNRCDECYVSIRSYLDKSFPQILRENVAGFFSFKSRSNSTP